MARLTIEKDGERRVVEARSGSRLLDVLRSEGLAPAAPCSGAGVCGKCRVGIMGSEGVDTVLACMTEVQSDMEVVVGSERQMAVTQWGSARRRAAVENLGVVGSGPLGLAFDIGTTTLACRLVDLEMGAEVASAGAPNPQRAYGADVAGRITACMDGYVPVFRQLIVDCARDLMHAVLAEGGARASDVRDSAVAGNTVMESIAAGIDPSPIGVAPFTPPDLLGRARPFLNELGETYFAPCVAGYVGGDAMCGLLASDALDADEPLLMVDLGTNGEMAVACRGRILTCSTAAGPVFEGVGVSCGMAACAGAISRVDEDRGELIIETLGGGPPEGLCGSGLIDAVALLLDAGIVDETGRLLGASASQGAIAERLGVVKGELAFFLTDDVYVRQGDIRSLQMGKAAISAGIETLLEASGLKVDSVGRMLIAGGLGASVHLASAARIGLFPQELLCRARSIGNASLEGATMLLGDQGAKDEIDALACACSHLELSGSATFNARFIEDMAFPQGR